MFQNTSKIFLNNSILTEDLLKIVEFVLKNNYFDFNSTVNPIYARGGGGGGEPPFHRIF